MSKFESIKSPSYINVRALIIFSFFVLMDQIFGLGRRSSINDGDLLIDALSTSFGLCVTVASLFLARWAYLRKGYARRHIWPLILTVLIVIFFSNICVAIIQELLAPHSPGVTGAVGFDRIVFEVIIFFAISSSYWSIREYGKKSTELKNKNAYLQKIQSILVSTLDAEEYRPNGKKIQEFKSDIQSMHQLNLVEIADLLRKQAKNFVRPLSHKVARQENLLSLDSPGPAISWGSTIKQVLAYSALQPGAMSGVTVFLFMRTTVTQPSQNLPASDSGFAVFVDWQSLTLTLLISMGVFTGTYFLFKLLRIFLAIFLESKSLFPQIFTLIGGVVAVSYAVQVCLQLISQLGIASFPRGELFDFQLTFFLPLVLTTVIFGVLKTVQLHQKKVLSELDEVNEKLRLELSKANTEIWSRNWHLAQSLHGKLQSALNAAAAQIDLAIQNNSTSLVDVVRIQGQLSEVVDSIYEADSHIDLLLEFRNLSETWNGVCKIDFDVSPEFIGSINLNHATSSLLLQIVIEAVANSIVHGSASQIKVHFLLSEIGQVELIVKDNGTGGESNPKFGLGFNSMRELAVNFDLKLSPTGSVLRVTLPASNNL